MKSVSISELKNKLSAILDRLPHVGAIRIVDRHKPIAIMYPIHAAKGAQDEELLVSLERQGVIVHQSIPLAEEILKTPPTPLHSKIDAVKFLIEDRRHGR